MMQDETFTTECQDLDQQMAAEICPICNVPKWRQIGPCAWECACNCGTDLDVAISGTNSGTMRQRP